MKPNHLLLILAILLFSCQKQPEAPPPPPCEQDNWGHIHLENFTGSRQEIYFDGVLELTIGAGATADIMKFPAGSYQVHFVDLDRGGVGRIDGFLVERCRTNLLGIVK